LKKLILLGAPLALLILAGCSGRSFDGKWNVTMPSGSMPPGGMMTATFGPGSGLAMTMDMSQPIPNAGTAKLHGDLNGSYTMKGDLLTVKMDSVKFSVTGVPDAMKQMMDANLKTAGDQAKESINKEGSGKVEWKSDDQFIVTGSTGSASSFTRAK
jgi:hypothetical protein